MRKQICGVLALLMLTGCSASLVNLQYKEGQLINKRLGLAYNTAPVYYEPVAIGNAYGYYGKGDLTLYEITGLDPKEWITEGNVGGIATVFYREGLTLPTLAEMAPEQIYVCTGDEVIFGVATVDDSDAVAELVRLYTEGEEDVMPISDSLIRYDLRFSSKTYPSIYYNLTYYEHEEGVYLYDRVEKRYIPIGDLLESWIENSWEE